jgi:fermentation-respiration switch protein FrsA (DUF1100 family)
MWSALLAALVGYTGLLLLVYFFQSGLLYLPHTPGRALTADPSQVGLGYEEVWIATPDGERLSGWWVEAPQRRGTLLFCHGNAGNMGHRLDSLRLFAEQRLDVLIFDYRGYGRSSGRPSERGTYRDARAAWGWLTRDRGVPPREIVLFGRSLGAAVALELATRVPAAGLVLESGFTSVPDLGAELYPFLPVRLLSRFRYDSLSRVGRLTMPLLVVHSRDDELIPFAHGQRLFQAAPQPKTLLAMRGGHNDGFLVSGADYRKGLDTFLDTLWQ